MQVKPWRWWSSLALLLAACHGQIASPDGASADDPTGLDTDAPRPSEQDRGVARDPGAPGAGSGAADPDDPGSEVSQVSAVSEGGVDADLGVDAGAALDPVLGAVLFDDFEGDAIDPARWALRGFEGSQMATPTTAAIDTTRAHTGSRSVLVRDGFLEAAAPAEAFYGRVYTWFAADPGPGHWMSVVALAPGNGRDTEVRYGGHYGILQANYYGNDDEVISDPKGYCAPGCDNGKIVPVGRWACVEFYFGKDEMRLWLDGSEVETLHVREWRNQKAPWSPSYDRLRVGFHNFQGPAPDVWLDDVAFDRERIGC